MKKLFTIALLVAGLQLANAQTKPAPATATKPSPASVAKPENTAPTVDATTMKWSEETWDFGTIPQGIPTTHEFKFTNNGTTPIVISKVDKSCGCTTPKWTTEPVLPGKTGFVSATFNAAAAGGFNKTVTVHSNTGTKVLYIKGTVKPKEGSAEPKPAGGHEGHNH